jgi:hypothetical protein
VRTDGTLWGWGNNSGELGDDSPTGIFTTPVKIGTADTWQQVVTQFDHTAGLRQDGTLWGWGANGFGQLGIPSRSATPLLIMGPTIPLPVELTAFTAQRKGPLTVALAWQTVSEQNSADFTVEQAPDGRTFTALGTVAGQGTTSQAHAYTFTAYPAPDAAYYRLVQRDLDGTRAYSPVVFVEAAASAPAATLQLVPNPAHDQVQLPEVRPDAALLLLDALGRPVRAGKGATLSLQGVPPGLYLLQATRPGQAPRTARLLVK